MIKGNEIKKVIKERKKYLILTPPSHKIIKPLDAIKTEVPKSGWDKTKIIGTMIIDKETIIVVKEFTFSIFNLW